jgi:hypothetical protein
VSGGSAREPSAFRSRCSRARSAHAARGADCHLVPSGAVDAEQCAARFGDTFTLRIAHEGTWIVLATPEDVKQVFTSDHGPSMPAWGIAPGFRCSASTQSCCSSRTRASSSASFCCRRFRGARTERYGDLMSGVSRRPRSRARRSASPPRASAHAGITLEIVLRGLFGLGEGERLERLRRELRRLLDMLTEPRKLLLPVVLWPERLARSGPFQRRWHASTAPSTLRSPSDEGRSTWRSAATCSRSCSRHATRTATR